MSPLVHHEEHEADIDADAACQLLVEEDVAREAVPVAVEGESDEFTLTVEHGRAAVAAGDVVVGEEAELHLAGALVGVGSEVLGRE